MALGHSSSLRTRGRGTVGELASSNGVPATDPAAVRWIRKEDAQSPRKRRRRSGIGCAVVAAAAAAIAALSVALVVSGGAARLAGTRWVSVNVKPSEDLSGSGGGGAAATATAEGASRRSRPRAEPCGIVYGTAWKKDRTASLVETAVRAGFRHIDTANFPVDYDEPGAGEGWAAAVRSDPSLTREDLFLQTKFTPVDFRKQDRKRLPYDGSANETDQIRQSVEGSLRNLGTDYLDAVLLHHPIEPPERLAEAWSVLESFVDEGKVRRLGLCDVHNVDYLRRLHESARVKPTIVQNRFHGNRGFDVKNRLRPYLREIGAHYQTFWTLTGNVRAWRRSEVVADIAGRYNMTTAQIIYAFVMSLGGSPLSGTKNLTHMEEDLEVQRLVESGRVLRKLGEGGGLRNQPTDEGYWNDEERMAIAKELGISELV